MMTSPSLAIVALLMISLVMMMDNGDGSDTVQAPTVVIPSDPEQVTATDVVLAWIPAAGIIGYDIQVDEDEIFIEPDDPLIINDTNVSATAVSYSVARSVLETEDDGDGVFSWRIRAKLLNETVPGNWSVNTFAIPLIAPVAALAVGGVVVNKLKTVLIIVISSIAGLCVLGCVLYFTVFRSDGGGSSDNSSVARALLAATVANRKRRETDR